MSRRSASIAPVCRTRRCGSRKTRRWRTLLAIDPDRDVAAPFAPSRRDPRTRDARRRRSRPAHAAAVFASAARSRDHRRQRHSRDRAEHISRKPSGCSGEATPCSVPPRRRLLADRPEAHAEAARAVCRGALVEPACSRRHARQSQRQARRLRRRRSAMSIPRMTIGDLRFYAERLISVSPKANSFPFNSTLRPICSGLK